MNRHLTIPSLIAIAALTAACAQPGTGVYRTDITDDMTARIVTGQADTDVTANIGTPYRRVR